MGRLFDPETYAIGWVSAPYLVAAFCSAVWLAYLLFRRGNPMLRMSLLAGVVLGLNWAVFQGLAGSAPTAEAATVLNKVSLSSISLIGAAAFAVLLATRDVLHRYRLLLVIALASTIASSVLCLTTDLVVDGVWRTPWDYWYHRAGPLNGVHLGLFVGWSVFGAIVAARATGRDAVRQRRRSQRIIVLAVLMVLGCVDALLAHGIGVYSIAWLTAIAANITGLFATLKENVIRARGPDKATAIEVFALAGIAVGILALFQSTRDAAADSVSVVAVVLIVPILGIAQLGFTVLRAHANKDTTDADLERAVDEFVAETAELRDEARLVAALHGLIEHHLALPRVRLYTADGAGFVLVDPDAEDGDEPVRARFDGRIRPWLMANRSPIIEDRLATQRLGGLRGPIFDTMENLDAAILLPLIDRDELIGLVIASHRDDERAISDVDAKVIDVVQDAASRALTYVNLYRAAQERVEVAREVEVAAAVHSNRDRGEETRALPGCTVISHYQPAGQFGGDFWSCAELADGRTLLMIGDVSGKGVPAALVTATVEGCCETAQRMLGAGFGVFDLLSLLNRSVLDVGHSRYLMTCWAGIFDRDAMSITFANAGHPFPYVCRRGQVQRGRTQLNALVSKGTPLGIEREPMLAVSTTQLAPDDVVVLYTDALVESENSNGVRYGERRFQRAIRDRLVGAGDDMCQRLIDDALGHYGRHPIREDITLVCMRVGA